MSLYSLPTFLGGTFSLLLGVFVYSKNRRAPQNISFALMCLSIVFWLYSYTICYTTKSIELATLLARIACTSTVFLGTTFYHFIVTFLGLEKEKKFVKVAYLLAFTQLPLFLWTNYLLGGVHEYFWGYYSKAGLFHPLFLFFFFTVCLRGIFLLFFAFRKKRSELSSIKFNQVKYILVACSIMVLGSVDFIPKYGIEFYPFGFLFILIYMGITAYAILRHQLMDIEVVIKKSLVFAGMFVFAFGVFVMVALLVSQLLGGGKLISLAISSLIIIIGLRPIETWLINSTDRFLFQKKYEYKQVLKAFIDEVITELNLDQVINSTLKLLDETLHPYAAAIFIFNKVDDKYQLYNAYGLEDKNTFFTSDSKLVTFLKKTRSPAIIKPVNGISGANSEVLPEMSQLKAVLVLPLMLHDDLIGFISLGRKKSDEEYTKDDLDVLLDLARTESIAVGNAQLLTEAAQSERRAAIGTMAAGINHEIGNPLNTMSARIQLFKLTRQKGMFKDKPVDEVLNQAEEALDECLEQSGRISEITRKLSNFAKPSKEFKPVLVAILEEIDETLGIVGHDLELERLKIEKNIPYGLPRILADRQEIQQIFFNIIRNAGQSIEGTGTITIRAFLTSDNKVRIEIQDTGKGISEDKKKRIFEPFFTTKRTNKGTGLGLSIVRQLVWRNKGEISFRSEAGAGAIFILEFPRGE